MHTDVTHNFQEFKLSKRNVVSLHRNENQDFKMRSLQPRQLSFLPVRNVYEINRLQILPSIPDSHKDKINEENSEELSTNNKNQMVDHNSVSLIIPESESECTKLDTACEQPNNLPFHADGESMNEKPSMERDKSNSIQSLVESINSASFFDDETRLELSFGRYVEMKKEPNTRRNAIVPRLVKNPLENGSIEIRSRKLRRILEYCSLIWHYQGVGLQRGDTHRFTVKERWWFLIKTLNKLLQSFDHQPSIFDQDIFTDQGPTAEFVLKLYMYVKNITLSSKIQYHYEKSRTDGDILRLIHYYARRCPFFLKLTYQQIVRILKYSAYSKIRKGATIIRQGSKAEEVYFLLSGQVLVYKNLYGSGLVTSVQTGFLIAGDSITQSEGSPSFQRVSMRDSTMMASSPCEVLSMSRCILVLLR
jgi:hypothetical protein